MITYRGDVVVGANVELFKRVTYERRKTKIIHLHTYIQTYTQRD